MLPAGNPQAAARVRRTAAGSDQETVGNPGVSVWGEVDAQADFPPTNPRIRDIEIATAEHDRGLTWRKGSNLHRRTINLKVSLRDNRIARSVEPAGGYVK